MVIYEPFQDPGAYAVDDRDGRVAVAASAVGNPVNTNRLTAGPDQAYLIMYTARDAANNRGVAFRRVAVYDNCTAPEFRCPDTRGCSVFGRCSAQLGALSSLLGSSYDGRDGIGADGSPSPGAVVTDGDVPVARQRAPDSIPPELTLRAGEDSARGSVRSTLFVDPTSSSTNSEGGALRLVTYVPVGVKFVDPGATAKDWQDGFPGGPPTSTDISDRVLVSVSPSSGVDTSHPSRPDAPFRLTYTVRDLALLAAAPAIRLVVVECPGGADPCPDPNDPDGPYMGCSVQGVCAAGLQPLMNTEDNSVSGGSGSTDSSGISSGGGGSSSDSATALLLLNGQESVTVPQYTPYVYGCFDAVGCDFGATASSSTSVFGDLNTEVLACAESVKVHAGTCTTCMLPLWVWWFVGQLS